MPPPRTEPRRQGDGRLDRPRPEPPPKVEATRRATLIAAAPVVLLLLFLGLQVALLAEQRRLIAGQKDLQEVLTARSLPVLDAARPIVEDLREDRSSVRAAARRGDRLVRESRPLVRASVPLVRESLPLVREATPLVQDLRAAGAPQAIADTGRLARQATEGRRLARALDATLATLAEVRRRDLLADTERAAELAPTTVEILRQTLAIQRETRDIQRATLPVLQEALVRIRSIDNKTGGPAPGAVPTAAR